MNIEEIQELYQLTKKFKTIVLLEYGKGGLKKVQIQFMRDYIKNYERVHGEP